MEVDDFKKSSLNLIPNYKIISSPISKMISIPKHYVKGLHESKNMKYKSSDKEFIDSGINRNPFKLPISRGAININY
jgi:hypothetical protein